MNLFVFDSHPEACKVWQDTAALHNVRACNYSSLASIREIPKREAQLLVVDQSVAGQPFAARIATICRDNPWQLVVATGSTLGVDSAVELMQAGVAHVFQKPLDRRLLLTALPHLVERAERKKLEAQECKQLSELFTRLTSRERDVLNYILVGTSNKETAELLSVSVRTIESRRAKVYRKLEASNVAELVRKIDRLEILSSCDLTRESPMPHQETHSISSALGSGGHAPVSKPHSNSTNLQSHATF